MSDQPKRSVTSPTRWPFSDIVKTSDNQGITPDYKLNNSAPPSKELPPVPFEEIREAIRLILIDPERLELGHDKVNLRVGGTTDRIMVVVNNAIQAAVREAKIELLEKLYDCRILFSNGQTSGVPIGAIEAVLNKAKEKSQ